HSHSPAITPRRSRGSVGVTLPLEQPAVAADPVILTTPRVCGFPTIACPRILVLMTTSPGDAVATGEMVRRLRGGSDLLTAAALRRLDRELAWYRALPAEDRSWIGLVAQSGIASFIAWYENQGRGAYNAGEIFRAAPPELTRSISLQHTLQLVRIVVEVVEQHTEELAAPGQQAALREAVLLYSREVAFSAAEVYARAAET